MNKQSIFAPDFWRRLSDEDINEENRPFLARYRIRRGSEISELDLRMIGLRKECAPQ